MSGLVNGQVELSGVDEVFRGEAENDQVGTGLAFAGDIDGDGHSDIAVGAPNVDLRGYSNGSVYVVRGPATGPASLGDAAARFVGVDTNDDTGAAISGGGDLNGDGIDDLVIGSPGFDGAGAAHVVFGCPTP